MGKLRLSRWAGRGGFVKVKSLQWINDQTRAGAKKEVMRKREQQKSSEQPVLLGALPVAAGKGFGVTRSNFSGGMTWTSISRSWLPGTGSRTSSKSSRAPLPPVQRNDLPAASGPVSPILQLHREIDRLFDDAFRGFWFSGVEHAAVAIRLVGMLKPAPTSRNRQAVQDCPEVPGVEEKDIQITLDNDVLMVRGEKRREQEKKEGGFHRVERAYGSFQRALNLPDDANRDSIKASFKNGVLTVTIDKREVSSPKQGARSRSTADVAGLVRHKKNPARDEVSRLAMPRRLNLVNLLRSISMPRKQCQSAANPPPCGWKPVSTGVTAPCCCATTITAN